MFKLICLFDLGHLMNPCYSLILRLDILHELSLGYKVNSFLNDFIKKLVLKGSPFVRDMGGFSW
jgi:hypothetical protein